MKPTTYLEKHVEELHHAYDNVRHLRECISHEEQVQKEVHTGRRCLTLSAEYGEYPVFDAITQAGGKVHIAMSYRAADEPVKGFLETRGPDGEKIRDVADNERPDPAVVVRFQFPIPKSGFYEKEVTWEGPLFTRLEKDPPEKAHPVARDFSLFLQALTKRGWGLYAHKWQRILPPSVDVEADMTREVMNTSGCWSNISFNMPAASSMSNEERTKWASRAMRLFFEAKGYSTYPKDVGAAVQEWHDSQGRRIDGMKGDLEQAILNLDRLNTQGFSESEAEYLVTLISTLKNLVAQYLSLKETFGDDIVFDPLSDICRSFPNLAPSERFRTLSSVVDGLKKACQQEDGENFLKKFKAIVTLLSNLEKSIRGDAGASSGTGWEWTEPLLLTVRSTN